MPITVPTDGWQENIADDPLGLNDSDKKRILTEALNLLQNQDRNGLQQASDSIVALARNFQQWQKLDKESHKISNRGPALETIKKAIRTLDLVRQSSQPVAAAFTATDGEPNPDKARRHDDRMREADELFTRGYAKITKALEMYREELDSWDRIPKGGKRLNVYRNTKGPPMRQLVEGCLSIFNEHLPGKASQTGDGPFYRFCAMVYELATGQGADEAGVGLGRYVQGVLSNRK